MRLLLFFLLLMLTAKVQTAALMSFWDKPQHGGNSFNRLPPDQAYFDALSDYNATWVRLTWDKWKPARRDFLIGDADDYQSLEKSDLVTLKAALSRAEKAGLKVVVVPLSLPLMRWSQNNGNKFDDRLWKNRKNWQVAARFWRDLAAELKGHPAIAAYNIINEPAPEKEGGLLEQADQVAMKQWYQKYEGSSRDLRAFYKEMIAAIRTVDPDTPIMVDSGWYAAASAFGYWPEPLDDRYVLYSFHMYEPWEATGEPNLRRATPYTWPGVISRAEGKEYWDAKRVANYLNLVTIWAKTHAVQPNRMIAGEFGCIRLLNSCTAWLDTVLTILDREQFHWAFYSFREDSWDAMNYEMGKKNIPWEYWQAIEKGLPDPIKYHATAEFEPIRRRL